MRNEAVMGVETLEAPDRDLPRTMVTRIEPDSPSTSSHAASEAHALLPKHTQGQSASYA